MFDNGKHVSVTIPKNRNGNCSLSLNRALFLTVLFGLPVMVLQSILFTQAYGKTALIDGLRVVVASPGGLMALILGIGAHELLHGLGWKIAGRLPWKQISFGFQLKSLTPYARVRVPLPAKAYSIGVILPLVSLGILPYLSGLMIADARLTVFGILFTLAAGGDTLVLWKMRRLQPKTLVEDHPRRAGCRVVETFPE